MRPPASVFRSPQIQTFTGFDTVYAINSALQQLEMGDFSKAALLSDATGRDDRISGVTSTRVGALLAAQLDLTPADADNKKAVEYASLLGGTDDAPGMWDRMFSQGNVAKLLRAGLHLNMGVAEIIWWLQDGIWWPRLNVWHTQFVRWDQMSGRYKLRTDNRADIDLPRLDDNEESEGRWFVWCPFGYQYAYLEGLIRALAPMFMRRMWINRDWARYNEVHGLPITKAIAPVGKNNQADEDFLQAVANRGSEPTILLKQGAESKYDVELLEATAQTYQTFADSKTDVNQDIAILMLGQNLTTEATGGGLGDGGASIHNLVRLDKAKEDAAFATALYQQVLRPWAKFNFGDPDLAPRPMFQVDPPEDSTKKAEVMKAVGDALTVLQSAKAPVNERATLASFGIELFTEDEVAEREAKAAAEGRASSGLSLTPSTQGAVVTVNEARSASGLGPLLDERGSPRPEGNLTVTDYAAQLANQAAANAPAPEAGKEPPAEGEEPKEEPGKTAALSADPAFDAIMTLAELGDVMRVATLRAVGKKARRYPDDLTARAVKLGARALASDIKGLRAEIAEATSFEELEKRLVTYYRDKMDPDTLARVVQRTRLMATLAGRLTVAKGA